MKKLLLAILMAFISTCVSNAQSIELILQPGEEGKDAIIGNFSPDNNYEFYKNFMTTAWTNGGVPIINRSLIQFDFSTIPGGAHITEAKLSLYFAYNNSTNEHCDEAGSNECVLSRINEDWDESTVTWNTQPTYTSDNEVILPHSIDPNQDYENIDVTALVQDMFEFGNYGFFFKLKNESYYRRMTFGSGDNDDVFTHPKLVIYYTMETGSIPDVPTDLSVSEDTPLNIDLNWTDNATNESNYIIERSEGTNTYYQPIDTLPANTTNSIITEDILNKTRYYFRVKAVDANGYYSYSDEISLITGSINISDGDTTINSKYYFDSGVNLPYNSHESFVQTISPEITGKILKIKFNTFSLSSGDELKIYDGSSISSPLLKTCTGTNLPDSLIATNTEGTFTFKFTSDGDILKNQGWEAYIYSINRAYPPHNLVSTFNSADSIKFSWADTISIETGFEIQKSINGGNFSTIHTTTENIVEFTDSNNIYTGTEYAYRIRTLTEEVYSSWSETLNVLTPGPAAPTNLLAESSNDTTVVLSWTDNSDNETGFIIERSLNSESGFTKISEVLSDITTYSDTVLTFNTEYYYRVRAYLSTDSSQYTSTVHIFAGAIIMDNLDITRCHYYLLDPGGLGNYPNSLNKTMTLNPAEVGKSIKLSFESFYLENGWDKLYVYNGTSVSDPLIGTFTGNSIPDSINATNTSGSLTLKITSDASYTYSGFKILVNCIGLPDKATDLNAIDIKSHEITFGWTDNSLDETGFSIYKSEELNGNYTLVESVDADIVQYTDINLNTGKTYYYKLRTIGTEGYTDFSDTLQVKTTGPLAPSGLSAISNNDTTVNLTWIDNSDNETKFIIERSLEESTGFEFIDSVGIDSSEYFDSSLVFNTTYYYRVFAVSGQDSSEYANTASVLTGAVLMDNTTITRCDYYLLDPGGLNNYSNDENKTIVLEPAVNGTKVKLDFESFYLHNNYDFLYVYDGSSTSDPLLATLTGSSLPANIIASNSNGILTLKFTSNGYTTYSGFKIHVGCFDIPEKPSELSLIDAATNSISVNWTDNSDNELEFLIYKSLLENGSFSIIDTTLENVNTYTDEGLISGTTYYYSVRASGVDGISNFSDTLTATTTGPLAPSDLIAISIGSTSNKVSWADNSNNEDVFIIERSLNESSDFAQIATTNANINWYNDEGLTFDTEYFYRVKAYIAEDSSEYTLAASARAGHVVLDNDYLYSCNYYLLDPGGYNNYENSLDKTVKLFPTFAGDKVKISFNVFDLEYSWDKLYVYDGSLVTDPLVATLTGNTIPDPIWATNSEGALTLRFVSDNSITREGFIANVNCIILPVTPSDLNLTSATKNSLNISWTDNSDNETGFIVYRSLSESGNFEAIVTVNENTTSFIDENVDISTYYYYKVRALSTEAYSDYSNLLTAKTRGVKTPTNLTAMSTISNTAVLNWIDNSTDETGFIVERSLLENTEFNKINTVNADETEYTDNSVEFDKNYQYRVMAINLTDSSEYSNVAVATIGSYAMNNEDISRCNFYLLDPGGVEDYSNSDEKWVTLTPSETGKVIKLNFVEFDLGDDNDSLIILNGNSSGNLLNEFNHSSNPDSLWANNSEGQLYLKFSSNATVNASGFKIYVGCVDALYAPTNMIGMGTYSDSLKIGWTDNSSNESGFELYRSLTAEDNYEFVKLTESNVTSVVDINLTTNTTYYYKVRAINSEIYTEFSNVLTVSTIASAIEDQINDLVYSIYPNPTNDKMNIQMSNKYVGKVNIEIYSTSGSLLVKKVFEKTNNELLETINLHNLPNGIYILNLSFKDKKIVNQIIKN